MKDIFTAPLHENISVGPASAMRVPGGWIYSNAIGGMTFVTRNQDARDLELHAAMRAVRLWRGSGMDPLSHFETIGEWFYRETGYLRPGKSDPAESHYEGREEERRIKWAEWCKDKNKELDDRIVRAIGV